jgi:hypothetical protein
VKAVEDGKFHIYSVKTIDEGMGILTGVKAGMRLDERLRQMAEKLRVRFILV